MRLLDTPIAGVRIAETDYRQDARGAFGRLFCEQALAPALQGRRIVQINHSRTTDVGTVRGMHLQRGNAAEMKLVRCLRGRVLDVALDLRHGSPTFMRWHAVELDPQNARLMIIPEGCAHGFQVLEPDSELLYLHTAAYAPEAEFGVHCQEPRAAIAWPLPVRGLSPRDAGHPPLSSDFSGLTP
ncbi:dTDP-4-dehydrorhamnose 3,5-epimerase [Paucibacter sp. APW11]|uniref:dTDP-4-dehydrorhamnose 3,5-epimerase n=1 Tax=Roseateles aquae TaxID=3077235 RepID=A0ABU3P8C0_9BURK|nr:dTDP-4-dehydrorhamnose 3,5-epimerase [Paucibacter sp. APW11]MDT8998824.1 dTDP-4-dehydrorhamnose 3,5-epimerase [Paucibacter sp. APW11]